MELKSTINVPTPGGWQPYKLVLLRVETVRGGQLGMIPDQLTLVRDDDAVELSRNPAQNRFITAYVPVDSLNP